MSKHLKIERKKELKNLNIKKYVEYILVSKKKGWVGSKINVVVWWSSSNRSRTELPFLLEDGPCRSRQAAVICSGEGRWGWQGCGRRDVSRWGQGAEVEGLRGSVDRGQDAVGDSAIQIPEVWPPRLRVLIWTHLVCHFVLQVGSPLSGWLWPASICMRTGSRTLHCHGHMVLVLQPQKRFNNKTTTKTTTK